MKRNLNFYQHFVVADQHPKFKMLRVEYGWAGEGRFWALNNRIAQAENCRLEISKKYNAASIASDLNLPLAKFKKYIKYLMDDCELIYECSPGFITTDILQENLREVMSARAKARERKMRAILKAKSGSPELSKSSPELLIISGDQNKKVKER